MDVEEVGPLELIRHEQVYQILDHRMTSLGGVVSSPVLSDPEHVPEVLTPNALTFGSPRILKGLHIHHIALSTASLCEEIERFRAAKFWQVLPESLPSSDSS